MANAAAMTMEGPTNIPVIDFRRQSMVLQWHTVAGTWAAYDVPPALVNGIAHIRPTLPNICIYAQGGLLQLQIGLEHFVLNERSPRIRCTRGFASFGFRRRFSVESDAGAVLYSYSYWTGRGNDFFRWLASRAEDAGWRVNCGRNWSEGVESSALRGA